MLRYLQVLVLDNGDVVLLGQVLGNINSGKFDNALYSAEAVIDTLNND